MFITDGRALVFNTICSFFRIKGKFPESSDLIILVWIDFQILEKLLWEELNMIKHIIVIVNPLRITIYFFFTNKIVLPWNANANYFN